jgi:predicted RNA-binding protein YlqC (UPF0109 family)
MAEASTVQSEPRELVKSALEYIARSLVAHPDEVRVDTVDGNRTIVLQLHVHPEDMGRVIGKQGRTARAIRQVVKAAATKAAVSAIVEIVE